MRYVILSICFFSLLFAGTSLYAAPEVSPRPEVQQNYQKLLEMNSCPGCDLAGAVMHRGKFSGADLEGANLAGARLNLADLAGANLRNANLQGASFGGADLAGADLTGANLTGAVIEGAYMEGAKMDGKVVVRKPHVEEDGPVVSEKVFAVSETSSKSLPFTNQAMIAKEAASQEAPAASAEEELKRISEPVAARQVREKQVQHMTADPVPARSKQLNRMAEAVVAENVKPQIPPAPVIEEKVQEETVAVASTGNVEKAAGEAVEAEEDAEPVREAEQAASEPGQQAEAVVPEEEKVIEQVVDLDAEKQLLVKKLLDDNRCVACDLSGVDLSGKDLEDADLERVNLRGANLRETDLEGANLKGADLRNSDLRDADLREADMYRADIRGADLTGVKFDEALIDSLISEGAIGVNFEGAIGN